MKVKGLLIVNFQWKNVTTEYSLLLQKTGQDYTQISNTSYNHPPVSRIIICIVYYYRNINMSHILKLAIHNMQLYNPQPVYISRITSHKDHTRISIHSRCVPFHHSLQCRCSKPDISLAVLIHLVIKSGKTAEFPDSDPLTTFILEKTGHGCAV